MGAKVCLNMIVKNEAAVIERCLEATDGQIDAWVIVDTGSLDETPAKIADHFAARGIPGLLVHGHFRNFEQDRNRALEAALASGIEFDYLLFLDADQQLHVDNVDWRENLIAPAYRLRVRKTGVRQDAAYLLHREQDGHWRGVTRSYLDLVDFTPTKLNGISVGDHADPSVRVWRAERDANLLREALNEDPDDQRNVFHLA
jgi:glycosyltransferase involved in cell wall biosynthesis